MEKFYMSTEECHRLQLSEQSTVMFLDVFHYQILSLRADKRLRIIDYSLWSNEND